MLRRKEGMAFKLISLLEIPDISWGAAQGCHGRFGLCGYCSRRVKRPSKHSTPEVGFLLRTEGFTQIPPENSQVYTNPT